MLKACWDCIAPSNESRERVENGGSYGIRLNGDTQRAPPWPSPQTENEIMFLLPRRLNAGDRIDVYGNFMSNKQRVSVKLITGYGEPDNNNVALQMDAQFSENNPDDKLSIKIIDNGQAQEIQGDYQELPASDWFGRDDSFNFGFTVRINGSYDSGHSMEIYIGQSLVTDVRLKHNINDVRFLTLNGDVSKVSELKYTFA